MTPERLRSEGDRTLAEKLLRQQDIKRVIRHIEEEEKRGKGGVRRRLLGTSLRLTKEMSPELHQMTVDCRDQLGVDSELETYVYPSADFNAAAVKPEAGRLFVLFSSSLLEAFRPAELKFVMGHELGHHLFGHHEIPVGYILRGKEPPRAALALQLFAWSRYAEISADRAGAACAQNPDAVARALFRLASGLRGDLESSLLNVRIDDFAAQVDDMQVESEGPDRVGIHEDWFSTHPFSPLRLKAAQAFFRSDLFTPNGDTVEALEGRIQQLMALMEPTYLEEKSEVAETMRRLLFAAAIAVADAYEGISEHEREVFEKFFGSDSLSEKLDVDAIKTDLPARIQDANEIVPHARRIQVIHDLCTMARAGAQVHPAERNLLHDIAGKLEISAAIVECTLDGNCELD